MKISKINIIPFICVQCTVQFDLSPIPAKGRMIVFSLPVSKYFHQLQVAQLQVGLGAIGLSVARRLVCRTTTERPIGLLEDTCALQDQTSHCYVG